MNNRGNRNRIVTRGKSYDRGWNAESRPNREIDRPRKLLDLENRYAYLEAKKTYVTDAKKMTKARARSVLAVDGQNYRHIQNAKILRQAWENLENVFEDKKLIRKIDLLQTLTSTKLQDCNFIEEYEFYINTITTHTSHILKELDFEIKEEMIDALLLSGLPDEYKPMTWV